MIQTLTGQTLLVLDILPSLRRVFVLRPSDNAIHLPEGDSATQGIKEDIHQLEMTVLKIRHLKEKLEDGVSNLEVPDFLKGLLKDSAYLDKEIEKLSEVCNDLKGLIPQAALYDASLPVKTDRVLELMKQMLGMDEGDHEPCGECPACLAAASEEEPLDDDIPPELRKMKSDIEAQTGRKVTMVRIGPSSNLDNPMEALSSKKTTLH